jgi:hypothetical protein
MHYKVFLTLLILHLSTASYAQMDEGARLPSIPETFDLLTSRWLSLSEQITTYEGLGQFCDDVTFRTRTIETLNFIHHYDSVVMNMLLDPTQTANLSHKQFKKSLNELQKFEEKYSSANFLRHLKHNCGMYRDLEREKKSLKGNSGMYSYDGQVLLIESDIQKYIKHIDKRIQSIDEHVRLLDIQIPKSD